MRVPASHRVPAIRSITSMTLSAIIQNDHVHTERPRACRAGITKCGSPHRGSPRTRTSATRRASARRAAAASAASRSNAGICPGRAVIEPATARHADRRRAHPAPQERPGAGRAPPDRRSRAAPRTAGHAASATRATAPLSRSRTAAPVVCHSRRLVSAFSATMPSASSRCGVAPPSHAIRSGSAANDALVAQHRRRHDKVARAQARIEAGGQAEADQCRGASGDRATRLPPRRPPRCRRRSSTGTPSRRASSASARSPTTMTVPTPRVPLICNPAMPLPPLTPSGGRGPIAKHA